MCRSTIAQLSLNTELCSEFPRVLANLEMSRAVPRYKNWDHCLTDAQCNFKQNGSWLPRYTPDNLFTSIRQTSKQDITN